MTPKEELENLESQLSISSEYDAKKDKTVQIVKSYFMEKKGTEPDADDVFEHIFTKCNFQNKSKSQNNISQKSMSIYELEDHFYENINKALFSKYKKQHKEAKDYFAEAQKSASILNNSFIKDQITFVKDMDEAKLITKLKIERCYESVNRALEKDKDEGMQLIGLGLSLANQIDDQKRILDFLSKCHYALYEFENSPHVAISLGNYIISQTTNCQRLQGWTYFHNGNSRLDLGEFQKAEEDFEKALELALELQYQYAIMSLYERLAVAHRNSGKLNIARQYYELSLTIGETRSEIKPALVQKNKLKCLIGLGNIEHDLANIQTAKKKENSCQEAENYFKQAIDLANQVNYPANKAVAFTSLGELYETRFNKKNPDAKRFYKLAYKINHDTLKLSDKIPRVKKDADKMK